MKRKTQSELLKELKAKEEILKERIGNLEIRKRKEEDRILTRQKILVGAYMIERVKNDKVAKVALTQELNQFLIRPHDRKLFGLDEDLANKKQTNSEEVVQERQSEILAC